MRITPKNPPLGRGIVINLTPHPIVILENEAFFMKTENPKVRMVIPTSGKVITAYPQTQVQGFLILSSNGFPDTPVLMTNTRFVKVDPIPEPQEGVYYVVSRIVAEVIGKSRKDLLVVSHKLTDSNGRILGVKGLSFLWDMEKD